jgi:hypothetical protein
MEWEGGGGKAGSSRGDGRRDRWEEIRPAPAHPSSPTRHDSILALTLSEETASLSAFFFFFELMQFYLLDGIILYYGT